MSASTLVRLCAQSTLPTAILLTLAGGIDQSHADVWTFETPSQNIQCSVGQGHDGADIFCTIIERSGPPARPRPSNCASDWGHTFFMRNRGSVQIQCGPTDKTKGSYERAEYGVTGNFGGLTCHSSKKGLRCENLDGHGFFLSRRKQSVF